MSCMAVVVRGGGRAMHNVAFRENGVRREVSTKSAALVVTTQVYVYTYRYLVR